MTTDLLKEQSKKSSSSMEWGGLGILATLLHRLANTRWPALDAAVADAERAYMTARSYHPSFPYYAPLPLLAPDKLHSLSLLPYKVSDTSPLH